MAALVLGAGLTALPAVAAPTDTSATKTKAPVTPSTPPPPKALTPATLPGGTRIEASPTTHALQRYLASKAPAGRTFDLTEIRFVKGSQVRATPTGALASMTALLNAHPRVRVRVEVAEPNPGLSGPTQDAADHARMVRQAFIANGLAASRISSAGVRSTGLNAPVTRLTVLSK